MILSCVLKLSWFGLVRLHKVDWSDQGKDDWKQEEPVRHTKDDDSDPQAEEDDEDI